MEMRIPMVVIPSSIEDLHGFYGFVAVEMVKFGMGSCVREIRGFFVVNHFVGLKSRHLLKFCQVFIPAIHSRK
jgi:hypothetical protein